MNLTRRPIMQKPAKRPSARVGREYMARVKALPCVVCGAAPPSDAHHVFHDRHGGRKTSDFDTIPLCKPHHQDGKDAIHNGKAGWRDRHGPDHGFIEATRKALGENMPEEMAAAEQSAMAAMQVTE